MSDPLARAARIELAAFDVDGVMTDGSLFIGDNGVEYKAFHSRDGHGLRMLQHAGVKVAIITGRQSQLVSARMESLGVEHVRQGSTDKVRVLNELLGELGIAHQQVAFIGDDLPDLGVMLRVGFAVAVGDAHPLVRKHAHWVTSSGGGRGAVREVCEFIMQAQGTLEAAYDRYLQIVD